MTNLTLQPDPPFRQLCGDCVHYRPYVDQFTKRVRPSQPGKCAWEPEVKWSMAHLKAVSMWEDRQPFIAKATVWKDTNATTCKCWEKK